MKEGVVLQNNSTSAVFEISRCCLQLFLVAMTADVTFLSLFKKKKGKELHLVHSDIRKICFPDLASFSCLVIDYTLEKSLEWNQRGINREVAKSASPEKLYAVCVVVVCKNGGYRRRWATQDLRPNCQLLKAAVGY